MHFMHEEIKPQRQWSYCHDLLVAHPGPLPPSALFSSKPPWIFCLQKHVEKCINYVCFLLFHWQNISIVWKGHWISTLGKVDLSSNYSSLPCFSPWLSLSTFSSLFASSSFFHSVPYFFSLSSISLCTAFPHDHKRVAYKINATIIKLSN